MASEVKTNKISPATSSTVTLGDASDVFQLPASAEIDIASGATLDVNGTIDVTGATTTGFPAGGMAGVQVYTAGGTWTKATRESALGITITKVIVEVQGAGSSGAAGGGEYAGGGAGGGYAKKLLDVTNTTSATISVGSGGTAVGTGSAGVAGGLSKFEENVGSGGWSDVIGNGGSAPTTGAYNIAAGGTGANGDINIQGGDGGPSNGGYLGLGGNSFYGDGGSAGYTGQGSAGAARGYGAGGGGGQGESSSAGANGIVIVWEYQ